MMRCVLLCLMVTVSPLLSLSPSSYLTNSDRARLVSLFSSSLGGDTTSLHYSVLGLKALKETVPGSSGLCATVSKAADEVISGELYDDHFPLVIWQTGK